MFCYTFPMAPLDLLRAIEIPALGQHDWDPTSARAGLVALSRISGQVAAAQAVLASVLRSQTGRHTRTAIVNELGCSNADAQKIVQLADVLAHVPAAGDALRTGIVTAEHVRALGRVQDHSAAETLLGFAGGENVDEFRHRIDRHHLESTSGDEHRKNQMARRSLTFGRGRDGTITFRGCLPTLEGEQFKASIEMTADAAYRRAHPERAETAVPPTETAEQRRADALIDLIAGNGTISRMGVVLVVNEADMTASVLGGASVALCDAARALADARTELFAVVRDMQEVVLKFGRRRRFATQFQKLVMAIQSSGTCSAPGCEVPWWRCHCHHTPDYDQGGRTDIDAMALVCAGGHGHHPDAHDRPGGRRLADGTWLPLGEPEPQTDRHGERQPQAA
jgi:hypothetical protein